MNIDFNYDELLALKEAVGSASGDKKACLLKKLDGALEDIVRERKELDNKLNEINLELIYPRDIVESLKLTFKQKSPNINALLKNLKGRLRDMGLNPPERIKGSLNWKSYNNLGGKPRALLYDLRGEGSISASCNEKTKTLEAWFEFKWGERETIKALDEAFRIVNEKMTAFERGQDE